MHMKLGRLPRTFNPAIPHWSALRMMRDPGLPAPPAWIDYTKGLPAIGMFGNDRWGDCGPCAAAHMIQLWQWNAYRTMPAIDTEHVLEFYSEVAGFDQSVGPPGQNPTDTGTVLQAMLTYWLKTGFPMPDGSRHKILAFFELDPRNVTDLNLATAESGAILFGIKFPAYLQGLESAGSLWSLRTGNAGIVGGHAITSAGYTPTVLHGVVREVETWGSTDYRMTTKFVGAEADEVYAVISPEFVERNGDTPFGIPLATWEQQMAALKVQP